MQTFFFGYVHSLDPDKIQELDQDIKSNGWGVKKVLDIENALDFLAIFQSFYHNTGRLPLTNRLLIFPDCDPPNGEEKLNMKNLYEMFHIRSLMVLCFCDFQVPFTCFLMIKT